MKSNKGPAHSDAGHGTPTPAGWTRRGWLRTLRRAGWFDGPSRSGWGIIHGRWAAASDPLWRDPRPPGKRSVTR